MDRATPDSVIGSEEQLRSLVGDPLPRVAAKERRGLDQCDREWLARSPFCLLATSGADGTCDVSPKGDPPGFTLVLDDTTIAIPDRPGNRRVDGFRNILVNPHIGLLYVIPGRGDTLRINGRGPAGARRSVLRPDGRCRPPAGRRSARRHRAGLLPLLQVFLRALWDPTTWNPAAVRCRAEIAHRLERPDEAIEDLERYYGAQYAEGLYRAT